ncbi:hypothetical protein Srufu_041520 [Streptomyces libani subsp. rufus]|nr:hypothetical protein Srufu_041520 [Streptomyces libani subsp. rufus]
MGMGPVCQGAARAALPTILAGPPWLFLAVSPRFASADVFGFPVVAPAAGLVRCAGLWVR